MDIGSSSSLAIVGFGVLADLFFEALRKRDHTGLFLLLWILIPLPIVYYSQLPMKYLVPCLPAIILLCFRLMEGFSFRVARAAAVALIVVSTGYSLLILRSDAEFAEFGRDALFRLIQPHVAAGEKVWFGGQYSVLLVRASGWGKTHIPGRPSTKAGDLLVWAGSRGRNVAGLFPHRTLVQGNPQISVWKNHGSWNRPLLNLAGPWLWGFGDSGERPI